MGEHQQLKAGVAYGFSTLMIPQVVALIGVERVTRINDEYGLVFNADAVASPRAPASPSTRLLSLQVGVGLRRDVGAVRFPLMRPGRFDRIICRNGAQL